MTQQICDDLYEEFAGLVYAPYTATKTIYDPATEIGDQIKIGDTVHSVVYNTSIVLDRSFISDLAIPSQEESTSEYPQNSVEAKIKDLNVKLTSQILRLDNSITLKVKAVQDDLDDLDINRVAKIELAVSPNGIGSTISACAGTISLTAGKLLITSGNFLLDKYGNVTINNGKFKGTVETGSSDEKSGAVLGNGNLSFTYDNTEYLRIIPSYWGNGSGTGRGAQLRAANYLYVADENGNQYFAVNTGGNPNGFTQGILCFSDVLFCEDISIYYNKTVHLGSNEITFSGNVVNFSNNIGANNLFFESAPCSGTNATSLASILAYLEKKIG